MNFDPETYDLFKASNFDAYDADGDRYPAVLKEGLRRHKLTLSDVLAVTQDFGVWAICKTGVFRADMRGIFNKRIEVHDFVPYSDVASIREESSGTKTMKIVLLGHRGTHDKLASIDFGAGGMENTPALAAAHRQRIYGILRQAIASAG